MRREEGISQARGALPDGFADLEPFVGWALATETERLASRESSTIEEMQVFYDAMMQRLPAIVQYLNQFPIERMSDETQRLLNMALSVIEVSIAVELYRQPQVVNGFDRSRFVIVE